MFHDLNHLYIYRELCRIVQNFVELHGITVKFTISNSIHYSEIRIIFLQLHKMHKTMTQ